MRNPSQPTFQTIFESSPQLLFLSLCQLKNEELESVLAILPISCLLGASFKEEYAKELIEILKPMVLDDPLIRIAIQDDQISHYQILNYLPPFAGEIYVVGLGNEESNKTHFMRTHFMGPHGVIAHDQPSKINIDQDINGTNYRLNVFDTASGARFFAMHPKFLRFTDITLLFSANINNARHMMNFINDNNYEGVVLFIPNETFNNDDLKQFEIENPKVRILRTNDRNEIYKCMLNTYEMQEMLNVAALPRSSTSQMLQLKLNTSINILDDYIKVRESGGNYTTRFLGMNFGASQVQKCRAANALKEALKHISIRVGREDSTVNLDKTHEEFLTKGTLGDHVNKISALLAPIGIKYCEANFQHSYNP